MKLIYVVAEDWYFYSHRLPQARAAQKAGFDVSVITNVTAHKEKIEAEGIKVIPLVLERRSLNPFGALSAVKFITEIYEREKPDLVHHIAMKPVLFGAVAARAAKVPRVINAFAGLGYVFSADDLRARFLRAVLVRIFRPLLKNPKSWLLLQNKDDLETLRAAGLVTEGRAKIIRGSGIDIDTCPALPLQGPSPEIVCVFAGRMIGIKGLETLKEAFALLAQKDSRIRLWLCGAPDPGNPGSWTDAEISDWVAQGDNVIYKGHCTVMQDIWAQAHIALQPSWGGEGVPKSLLEAAAYGRAIIASDVPGCREVVQDGVNGFLVKPRDAQDLAGKIEMLARDLTLCRRMGDASRDFVASSDMTAAAVAEETKKFYRSLI